MPRWVEPKWYSRSIWKIEMNAQIGCWFKGRRAGP